jgi:hypothetical protein
MAGRANLGYSKDLTIATREFLHSVEGLEIVPGHFVIDKSKAYDGGNTGREWVIRVGCFMSQNASTKKWGSDEENTDQRHGRKRSSLRGR